MIKREKIKIPTYEVGKPEELPMFFERRNYQGASGKVYPLPFSSAISDQKSDKEYDAYILENKYIRATLLPEIGGKVHSILDKTNFIMQSGFKRVLVDFSKTKVNRSQIKAVSTSMVKAQPLPDVSRFNWKDGFYDPQQIEEFKAANERAAERASAKAAGRSGGRPNGGGYGRPNAGNAGRSGGRRPYKPGRKGGR